MKTLIHTLLLLLAVAPALLSGCIGSEPSPDGNEHDSPRAKETCCEPAAMPDNCFHGAWCCADGTWECGGVEGEPPPCGGDEGLVCEEPRPDGGTRSDDDAGQSEDSFGCCEPAAMPDNCFHGAWCCADGTWECGGVEGEPSPCGGDLCELR